MPFDFLSYRHELIATNFKSKEQQTIVGTQSNILFREKSYLQTRLIFTHHMEFYLGVKYVDHFHRKGVTNNMPIVAYV